MNWFLIAGFSYLIVGLLTIFSSESAGYATYVRYGGGISWVGLGCVFIALGIFIALGSAYENYQLLVSIIKTVMLLSIIPLAFLLMKKKS